RVLKISTNGHKSAVAKRDCAQAPVRFQTTRFPVGAVRRGKDSRVLSDGYVKAVAESDLLQIITLRHRGPPMPVVERIHRPERMDAGQRTCEKMEREQFCSQPQISWHTRNISPPLGYVKRKASVRSGAISVLHRHDQVLHDVVFAFRGVAAHVEGEDVR